MRYFSLISYRDRCGGGYALLASICGTPASASMVAYDPTRKTSIRLSQIEGYDFLLDVSVPYKRDRELVIRLIAEMPKSFEELKVLLIVCDI